MFGGRQLPPWMLKSNSVDQAISEIKEKNKDDDSKEVDNKACKPQKKIKRMQRDTGVSSLEKKSHLLKKCESRSKRKLIKEGDDEDDDVDGSDQEKKESIKAVKRSRQGDEQHFLNECETTRRKIMSNEQPHDQGNDLCGSDMENNINNAARKRHQLNVPRRRKQKEKYIMEPSHDGITKSIASDNELTVEDLISIAEEYMNAERGKDLQNLQKLGLESEVKPLYRDTSKIGSEKDLTGDLINSISVTDRPQPTSYSVTKSLLTGGSVTNPVYTGDPTQDMLDLFLGPLLKTSKEVEREANFRTEKLMLDHELSHRRQNDTTVEVGPVTKKSSFKDKVCMLLD